MHCDSVITGIKLRSSHFKLFFNSSTLCSKIILISLVIDKQVVNIEEKSICFEHLIGSWMNRAKLIRQTDLIYVWLIILSKLYNSNNR